ncbi:hypothetical protein [Flavobacterium sp.]|uniref:hypothetical protein n=1 Tax=Flavobacterium sp. TaxID=239 RepID=UPI0037533530
MKKKAISKVPVLLMFFVRPEKLMHSFEAVKKARPEKLFLVSDGPRVTHPNDKYLNDQCRVIVDDIDWECEVHHFYSEENKGMHYIAMTAFKKTFEIVDRLIFLEDDVVPCQSFFPYCEELLEKYKDDLRIQKICGMNHQGVYESPSADYFFSKAGSIWGFALWKRTFEAFEEDLAFTQDAYHFNLLLKSLPKTINGSAKRNSILLRKQWEADQNTVVPYELANAASFYLNNSLLIVPKKNMINCMGISANAGHNVDHPLKLPSVIRSLFYMKTYELTFPLKHPKYIINDVDYEKIVLNKMGKNKFILFTRRVEGVLRRIFYGYLLKK